MSESGIYAGQRDASWLRHPRHDGGGNRSSYTGVRFHVCIDHPVKGESWSACGTAFLIGGQEDAEKVPAYSRCKRNGCRQLFARADQLASPSTEEGSDADA